MIGILPLHPLSHSELRAELNSGSLLILALSQHFFPLEQRVSGKKGLLEFPQDSDVQQIQKIQIQKGFGTERLHCLYTTACL